eukprot:9503789-Pyramimonas_sp.AAC.6
MFRGVFFAWCFSRGVSWNVFVSRECCACVSWGVFRGIVHNTLLEGCLRKVFRWVFRWVAQPLPQQTKVKGTPTQTAPAVQGIVIGSAFLTRFPQIFTAPMQIPTQHRNVSTSQKQGCKPSHHLNTDTKTYSMSKRRFASYCACGCETPVPESRLTSTRREAWVLHVNEETHLLARWSCLTVFCLSHKKARKPAIELCEKWRPTRGTGVQLCASTIEGIKTGMVLTTDGTLVSPQEWSASREKSQRPTKKRKAPSLTVALRHTATEFDPGRVADYCRMTLFFLAEWLDRIGEGIDGAAD